ncbi:MAG: RagB/SusD family nutrient uptake outer membrane protein [Mangrovibacterium sp.]
MEKIKYSVLLGVCLLLLGMSACDDQFLEKKKDYSILSSEDVFSDPKQAEAVFANIYYRMMSKYTAPIYGSNPVLRQTGGEVIMLSFMTEELPVDAIASGIGATGNGNAYYANATSKNTYAGNHVPGTFYWNGAGGSLNNLEKYTVYSNVNLINSFVTEIDVAKTAYPQPGSFWDNLKGQAVFARAWIYFDAVRLFGGLPYYTTETDMPGANDRNPRLSNDECIEKICADFQTASELLPATWDDDNYGRFTSVAALAMISRVRLYAASPVFNANWDSQGSIRWQAALNAARNAKDAANAAGYVGVNSLTEWNEAFYSPGLAKREGIIVIPKTGNQAASYANKWESFIRPTSASGSGPGIPAPDKMINSFPLSDGRRASDADGTAINGYDPIKFFKNRDPRFYSTFAFSGCKWPGTTDQLWLYAYKNASNQLAYTDGSDSGVNAAKRRSKALVWKMANPTAISYAYSGADILEYRYAEILLNLAECQAATGDVGGCQNTLNELRSRVEAGNIPTLTDKYSALEAVLYERFVELAYEGKRSWDCRRWLLYEGGAGFDPTTGNNEDYDPDMFWGTGWKIYDGKSGRDTYSKSNNVLTMLGLSPISGTRHTNELWAVKDLTVGNNEDPLLSVRPTVPAIEKNDPSLSSKLNALETFYDTNLKTIVPPRTATTDPATGMNVSWAMDSGGNTNAQAINFRFTWRGWFNLYPIHYNQRIQENNNTWIDQTVGWNIGNTTTKDQDGTWEYCLPE